jgi:hypothetical protein
VLLPVMAACACGSALLGAAPLVAGARSSSRHAAKHRAVARAPRHAVDRTNQLAIPFADMRLLYAAARSVPRAEGPPLLAGLSHQHGDAPDQRDPTDPRREEDRIRPVVDSTGAQIWVTEEDLFWHDIVLWPPRSHSMGIPMTTRWDVDAGA